MRPRGIGYGILWKPALAPVGPQAILALESDTLNIGPLNSWGVATIKTGTPKVLLDTVTGISRVSFDTGSSLAIPAGSISDTLSSQPCEVIVVWRMRKVFPNAEVPIIDSSANNAHTGYRLVAVDTVSTSQYREMRVKVGNGTSWLIDEEPNQAFWNAYADLKTNVTSAITTPTRAAIFVDTVQSFDEVKSATLPTSPGGNIVIGDGPTDIFSVHVFSPPLSASERQAFIEARAERYQVPIVTEIAGDGVRHKGIPGSCRLANGDILASYRNAFGHGNVPPGWLEITKLHTTNGVTVTKTAPYEIHDTSPTVLDLRDCNVTRLASGNILLCCFAADSLGYSTIRVYKSTDGGNTFPTFTTVGPFGYAIFEACSAPIVEDPAHPGVLWLPAYLLDDGGARSLGVMIKSTNEFATYDAPVIFADGNSDNVEYYEPGFLVVSAATAAKYPDLNEGDYWGLVRAYRNGGVFEMREFKSTNAGASWTVTTPVDTTDLFANSAGRPTALPDGTIIFQGRPLTLTSASIYTRSGPDNYDTVPYPVPGVDASTGVFIYGTTLPNPAASSTPAPADDWFDDVYSPQFGTAGNENCPTRYRRWPSWQLKGKLPAIVTPLTASVAPAGTVQINANGADPFTYPIHTNASGAGAVSGAGLYTAGATPGTDVVWVTDLNGQVIPVTITVTGGGGGSNPSTIFGASLKRWFDSSVGLDNAAGPLGGGGSYTTWTSVDGGVANAVAGPTTETEGGQFVVDFNGSGAYFNVFGDSADSLVGTGDWIAFCAFKDLGSIADTGTDFLNAAILASVSDGKFAIGTASTKFYAGQDATGTHYGTVTIGAGWHYVVVKYVSADGKIYIALDGGAFDAGTTVSPIGGSAGSLTLGKSGVVTALFRGRLRHLGVVQGTLSAPNKTALDTYLAASLPTP